MYPVDLLYRGILVEKSKKTNYGWMVLVGSFIKTNDQNGGKMKPYIVNCYRVKSYRYTRMHNDEENGSTRTFKITDINKFD